MTALITSVLLPTAPHNQANTPTTLLSGMNQFLESLEITFRRDPTNHRPVSRRGLTAALPMENHLLQL